MTSPTVRGRALTAARKAVFPTGHRGTTNIGARSGGSTTSMATATSSAPARRLRTTRKRRSKARLGLLVKARLALSRLSLDHVYRRRESRSPGYACSTFFGRARRTLIECAAASALASCLIGYGIAPAPPEHSWKFDRQIYPWFCLHVMHSSSAANPGVIACSKHTLASKTATTRAIIYVPQASFRTSQSDDPESIHQHDLWHNGFRACA